MNPRPSFRRCLPLLALALLPACYNAQKKRLLTEEFRSEAVSVPLTLGQVNIVDRRVGVEARPLKMHVQEARHDDAVQPPLTDARKALIQSELARYFSEGKKPVTVTAELTLGKQAFAGSATRSSEQSAVEVKLTFADPDTGGKFFEGSGQAKNEVESSSGSQSYSDALFDRSLQIAVYSAMRGVQSGLANGTLHAN